MHENLKRLRSALMNLSREEYWSNMDMARCRHLTPGNEAQRQVVMWSLRENETLLNRMRGCGEVDEHNNMQRCQVPLCPRCHMNRRGSETAKAIYHEFPGVPNEQLAHLTVLMPVDPDLANITSTIEREERRLRNFLIRKRREDRRWDEVHLLGYWELDRLSAEDIASEGRNTRLFLRQSGAPITGVDATLWLPHFHAIVALGEITRKEFAAELRSYGHDAAYQVNLKMFDVNRQVKDNIRDVVRYGNKFRIEEDYKGKPVFVDDEAEEPRVWERHWWSQEEIRAYAEWLCGEHRGFQSMRFVIGKKNSKEASVVSSKEESVVEAPDVMGQRGGASGVGVRYNNVVQDTNWLPPYLRKKLAPVGDGHKTVYELFEFEDRSSGVRLDNSHGNNPSSQATGTSGVSERLRGLLRHSVDGAHRSVVRCAIDAGAARQLTTRARCP